MSDSGWGADVRGWAEHWGRLANPAREAVVDALGIRAGMSVLDIGCGTGEFCVLISQRGATVSGIDAAEGMVAIARERLPDADLRTGPAERLPWETASFDAATAFNSLQFAADFVAALAEAARVVRPGGRIAVCNWGRREDCELKPVLAAMEEGEEPAAADPPSPGDPGELERRARAAGLRPLSAAEVSVPYAVPDAATLASALHVDAAMGGLTGAAAEAGVQRAVDRAAPYRRPDGSYRFENRFRYIVAAVDGTPRYSSALCEAEDQGVP